MSAADRRFDISWLAAALVALAIFVGAGCAAGPQVARPRVGTIDEVRDLERSIEQSRAITGGAGECIDRCRAVRSICDSSERICAIASDLAELSALESCRRAEQHCVEARRRVGEECECAESGGPSV